jgi:hypothetical protein
MSSNRYANYSLRELQELPAGAELNQALADGWSVMAIRKLTLRDPDPADLYTEELIYVLARQ